MIKSAEGLSARLLDRIRSRGKFQPAEVHCIHDFRLKILIMIVDYLKIGFRKKC